MKTKSTIPIAVGLLLTSVGAFASWGLAILQKTRVMVQLDNMPPHSHVSLLTKGLKVAPNYVLVGTVITLLGVAVAIVGVLMRRTDTAQ